MKKRTLSYYLNLRACFRKNKRNFCTRLDCHKNKCYGSDLFPALDPGLRAVNKAYLISNYHNCISLPLYHFVSKNITRKKFLILSSLKVKSVTAYCNSEPHSTLHKNKDFNYLFKRSVSSVINVNKCRRMY